MTATGSSGKIGVPLLVFAVGYNIAHHNGAFFQGLGSIGETRIADWLDLAAPWVVLGPLVWAMLAAAEMPSRKAWLIFAAGAVLYVEGHGIHLAANSISNAVAPDAELGTDAIHLWDEVVGHYLWYAGLAIAAAIAVRSLEHEDVGCGPIAIGAALVSGTTWATNALEGGTAIFSLLIALATIAYVWPRRISGIARLTLIAAATASLLLLAWGARYTGFPQPSSLPS